MFSLLHVGFRVKVIHTLLPFFISTPFFAALLLPRFTRLRLKHNTEHKFLGDLGGGVQYTPLQYFVRRGKSSEISVFFSCKLSAVVTMPVQGR